MNIDFHVHGLLSKKSDFDEGLLLQGIEIAKENGLNAFVMCEHFNSRNILDIFSYLENNYMYYGDRYIINNFSVFIGMEIDVKNGGHVILSGNRRDILEIRGKLEQYMKKPDFIELSDLLDLAEQYNCLVVGSHPFRETHKLFLQPKNLLKRFDALDLNATDIFSRDLKSVRDEVEALSKELEIPYVTGSDSHYPIQLGSVKTCFNKEFTTIKELKDAIKGRDFEAKVSKTLKTKVFSAKITKAYLKSKAV